VAAREFTSSKAREGDEATVSGRVEFILDGVLFEADATVSLLDLGEMLRFGDIDSSSTEGLRAMSQFLDDVLGREVYDRLRRHFRKHRTDPDTILGVVEHIVEAITERPTEAPSTSARSTSPTAPTSTEPSSTPATLPHRVVSLAGGVSAAS
jgi:hypothetical protein